MLIRACSGARLGSGFLRSVARIYFVELLNDLRAALTKTAFGDQVQFFNRETAQEAGPYAEAATDGGCGVELAAA